MSFERFYPGFVSESALQNHETDQHDLILLHQDIPKVLQSTICSVKSTANRTTINMLSKLLEIENLLLSTTNKKVYKSKSDPVLVDPSDRARLDQLHEEARHYDIDPKKRKGLEKRIFYGLF